jgi:tRNA threonylcarbamoyladenosine biosynthesis protein TsaE
MKDFEKRENGEIEREVCRSAEETRALGGRVAEEMPDGALVCLHGDLGAGKTCFVQGMARALGIRRPVGSPTFTLVNEYRGKRGLAHIDLYRIRGAADAFSLGLEDYLQHYPGIVAVEWAERAEDFMPEEAWHVRLGPGASETERVVEIVRPGRG